MSVLVLYAILGHDGLSDFTDEARFDPQLKARLDAFVVSTVYCGVVVATLVAARLGSGGEAWLSRLALDGSHWRKRDATIVATATLGYAVTFTLFEIAGRERHLPIAGPTDVVLLGTLVINLVILAPLAEELFFRGWVYTALRAHWRFLPSLLLTGAGFVAIHWESSHRHMLRVLPLALGVGLMRELTGGIRPSLALHASYNGVIVALTLAAA